MRVSSLYRYPVKSCRGTRLESSTVEPWGLAGDRRWMVVDGAGRFRSARVLPELLLIRPVLRPDGALRLHAPVGRRLDPIDVPVPRGAERRDVAVWDSELSVPDAGDAVSAWLGAALSRAPGSLRLVWIDDPRLRPTDPDFGADGDVVSFADGYPLLLTTEASLAALDDEILARAPHGREPLPMLRFRPNVVVRGGLAWAEDDWRRIRIGGSDGGSDGGSGVVFRAVKACSRCLITTLDPDTAEKEREPLRALGRTRKHDGGLWFGVNLVPDLPSTPSGAHPAATIRVGDVVEVLDAVEPGGGPLRAPTRNRVAPAG